MGLFLDQAIVTTRSGQLEAADQAVQTPWPRTWYSQEKAADGHVWTTTFSKDRSIFL
jgi:hypothetical protein